MKFIHCLNILRYTYNNQFAGINRVSYCKYSELTSVARFVGIEDRFKGITVDCSKEKCEEQSFHRKLKDSISNWQSEHRRCIWFKIYIEHSSFVPILAQNGFNFHHARNGFVMMYKWLPRESQPNLPPASHTNLGVGSMVFNNREQLLVISEKNYGYPHWKLPGGYVESGENILDAAKREVKEETGIECEFESLVTLRHTHKMMYGNSDIYILVRMKALTENIIISEREINACKWMNVEEYTTHPHVHAFNKLIVLKALEYKDKNIKLDIQRKTVKWATHVRDMHFLILDKLNS